MSLTFITWIGNQPPFQRSWAAGVFCSRSVVLYRECGIKPVGCIPEVPGLKLKDDWDFTALSPAHRRSQSIE